MACSASVSCSTGTGSAVTMAYSSSSSVNTSGAIFTQIGIAFTAITVHYDTHAILLHFALSYVPVNSA